MFISVLELFKIGVGPSSSHTLGPMVAAYDFLSRIKDQSIEVSSDAGVFVRCTLKGSLAFTGKGHSTDRAVALGLHGHLPQNLTDVDVAGLVSQIWKDDKIEIDKAYRLSFIPSEHIIFDKGDPLPEHPNGLIFDLMDLDGRIMCSETYFSIGGGFICTLAEISQLQAPLKMEPCTSCRYPFDSASTMLEMAEHNGISISHMKLMNELEYKSENTLLEGMDAIWLSMQTCIEKGLGAEGILPGGLGVVRRAKDLYQHIEDNPVNVNINDWLCAYAMAVNEENAAGNMVVTAPTNGAAGVIPAVLYYFVTHEKGTIEQVREFLLTASAIGGLIKHRSSISGAEVGCQGEVGSAAAMAAAGLCAVHGGTPQQVENAAEIALEHHLGMTCDPVGGLVQVPCIERNGFGAIKAYTAASLALRGSGEHFMPLDNCIEAMKQTGLEMSHKYKETSLGGLAVSLTEC
ncbi:MAG: L-serine ammonia-lyase [Methylococcales bacterium]|jgi:L-serine dehydratase|nr:L-serine ammonia-lyase [Methylococcales bacterium]MBT7442409.1 L-serine ammonia-lyase [Methylococcales bacterium]